MGSGSSAARGCAATKGPRFSSTIRARFGGFGVVTVADAATNSSSSAIEAMGLKRRSKPIVVEPRELMATPHRDPATCPGKTSTPSGSSRSRRSEWKRPSAPSVAPTARSGRAASPTKSESPVRTSHGSSARVVSIDGETAVLGTMPRRVDAPERDGPHHDLGSVLEWVARIVDPRLRMDAHRYPRARGRGGRGPRRGPRGYASRASVRHARRAAPPRRARPRSRRAGRRPRRCRPPRSRRGTRRTRDRRSGSARRAPRPDGSNGLRYPT